MHILDFPYFLLFARKNIVAMTYDSTLVYVYNFRFEEKNLDRDSNLGPTDVSFSLGSNAIQGVLICNTVCHHLAGKLTSSLFLYFDVWKQIGK